MSQGMPSQAPSKEELAEIKKIANMLASGESFLTVGKGRFQIEKSTEISYTSTLILNLATPPTISPSPEPSNP